MRIAQILFSQGFGTRRDCSALVQRGDVAVAGRPVMDADEDFAEIALHFTVQGRAWQYHATALVLLHKPAGYECSQKPRHHPSVMSLLPAPLRTRGVQPVGRLDEDTTGLLLFTDDGALIHRLTSPKHHVDKVYEVGTRHPLDESQLQRLRDGVVLDAAPAPVRAVAVEQVTETHLRLTLGEGKYHQVKRMLAAAGNRVETLHRSRFGPWVLPADMAPGHWTWLDAASRFGADGACSNL